MNKKNQKQIFLKLRPIKLKQSQSISKLKIFSLIAIELVTKNVQKLKNKIKSIKN